MRESDPTDDLNEVSEVASGRLHTTIERALAVAKEKLGMDVAFVSEFARERMIFRKIVGDGASFGWQEGRSMPLDDTFCHLLMEGRLPSVVPDATENAQLKRLDVTDEANIGSYVGVPIRFSDGRLYGTFCVLSHSPNPALKQRDAQFMRVLARLVADQLEREELQAEKQCLAVESAGLGALLAALEARDGYSGEHSKAVMELSVEVARQMDFPEEEVSDIRQAALLHDIGKVGVPDSVLKKRGPLTDIEQEVMQQHTAIGACMVAPLEGLGHLAPIIRATHERWDGKGYPDGLKGEEIPLASRIVSVCDAWHAMTSDRPYRMALSTEGIIDQLRKYAGEQFDPGVILALTEVLKSCNLRPPMKGDHRENTRSIKRSSEDLDSP